MGPVRLMINFVSEYEPMKQVACSIIKGDYACMS